MEENPYKAPSESSEADLQKPNNVKRKPPYGLLWLLLLLMPILDSASMLGIAHRPIPLIVFGCVFVFVLYRWTARGRV
jgi:hypothetical protein